MKIVLILEDDVRLGASWQAALEGAGYRVIREVLAENAIEVLKTEPVDLMITDMLIRTPHGKITPKGGLSVIAYIRLHMVPGPPIIVATGASPDLNIDKHAEALRANLVLEKPLKVETLLEHAARLLDGSAPRRSE